MKRVILITVKEEGNFVETPLLSMKKIKNIKKQFYSQLSKELQESIEVIVIGGDSNKVEAFFDIEITKK